MLTFLKAQVASLSASLVDYLTSMIAHYGFGMPGIPAHVMGNVVGGIVNFCIGRYWTFEKRAAQKTPYLQIGKYLLVWLGNLGLNTAGVYLLLRYGHMELAIAKIIVSLIVGFSYNYLLQKKFVFK